MTVYRNQNFCIIFFILLIYVQGALCSSIDVDEYNSSDPKYTQEALKRLEKFKNDQLSINDVNDEGSSLLHSIILHGSAGDIDYLIKNGVDLNKRVWGIHPVIFTISDKCRVEKLKLFLDNGISVNYKDEFDNLGNSLLHYSSTHPNTSCLRLLIERGANVNAVNNNNETAYFTTVNKKSISILWEAGADIFIKNKKGLDIIHYWVLSSGDELQYFKQLLEKEVESISTDSNDLTN